MSHVVTLSTCSVNQWALDFSGNLRRIVESIRRARANGSSYRVGPELETCGYGCEDHFLEHDTIEHSWEVIATILASEHLTANMVVDIGAPVYHRGVLYNCRVVLLNRRVVVVRPKTNLADDGNYRESRWFRAWDHGMQTVELPMSVRAVCGQKECAFGASTILVDDDGVTLGSELCEELWRPGAKHLEHYLQGVDVVSNGSGSHHVLRKLESRFDLIRNATKICGGAYLYANIRGCDGARVYYDGAPLVALNGELLAVGEQFGVDDEVDVVTVTFDICDIRRYRASSATYGKQGARVAGESMERLSLGAFRFASRENAPQLSVPIVYAGHGGVENEIGRGPACWLWDYLRRSGMRGFFIPLSGGADSGATLVIAGSMCQELVRAAAGGKDERLLSEIRRATGADALYVPREARELASRLICTTYMGASRASSDASRERARRLAEQVGSRHLETNIDEALEGIMKAAMNAMKCEAPRCRADGGSGTESVALQNAAARTRMIIGYAIAQLAPWSQGCDGSLLVLACSNVDEALRGYLTKYDCSAGDLNPIGGISKRDLRAFLQWAARHDTLGYTCAAEIANAAPSAELEPAVEGRAQTDEQDMGMTYDELSLYGRLRLMGRCGPLSMFLKLQHLWSGVAASVVAEKVKHFWRMYAINRHKLTTLTPAYHAEDYAPDDNRFDLRQFLYNTAWTWQFRRIDDHVAKAVTSATEEK